MSKTSDVESALTPKQPPLLEQTIPSHFASIVSKYGDRPAVTCRQQNITLSYNDLDAQSDKLAEGLTKTGVRKGDRVSIFLGNNIEFATTTYALFKLGAILNPLNPNFNTTQLTSALNHLESSHLIISAETQLARKQAPRSNVQVLIDITPSITTTPSSRNERLRSHSVPSLRHVILVDNSNGRLNPRTALPNAILFNDVLYPGGPTSSVSHTSKSLHPYETINIQFTSGTTSAPKAAMLTHHSILNNAFSIGARMRLTPDDVIVCPPPLFHCFGSILGYMACATHGAHIVFPSESFDAEASLRAVQEMRATGLHGVSTMFLAELDLLKSGKLGSVKGADGCIEGFENLRTGIAAGSSVPSELMRKLRSELGLNELTICYGMTETSPVSCMTRVDDPIEMRTSTVGRLLPHVEAKVVSADAGADGRRRVVNVGERGELAVRGYSVMQGYWNDEARTKEIMFYDDENDDDEKNDAQSPEKLPGNARSRKPAPCPRRPWILTGDEASMDSNGFVTITGRIKDIIIRGGENIYPLEIENCLLAHPRISEASVVGLPDEKYGEIVAAFVVLAQDPALPSTVHTDPLSTSQEDTIDNNLRSWVREKLSGHLVPKHIFHLTSSVHFPKTASGKIQKFKLREEGIRRLRGISS